MESDTPVFLSAEWRKLLMANYIIAPELLSLFVPPGTELDYWKGNCYVSLVGFMFLNTKLKGISIPYHQHFEEINLRFYVRRKVAGDWRRGVVFIKEIVPKPAISWVANTIYKENYVTRLMKHQWFEATQAHSTSYAWKPFWGNKWNEISATHSAETLPVPPGSEAEFITEHYWGYAKKYKKGSVEYEVRHPRWSIHTVSEFHIKGSMIDEYGPIFSKVLAEKPASVFLADGSPIEVMKGGLICVE